MLQPLTSACALGLLVICIMFKAFLMQKVRLFHSIPLCFLTAFLLVACGQQEGAGMAGMKMPPQAVSVIEVHPGKVALQQQLPGRLEANHVAEVHARVKGIVEKRLFIEGSNVKAGQSLFSIDAGTYEADYHLALASLEKAKADLEEAEYQAKRYEKLFADKAVSEFDLVQARAKLKQATALVQAADAEVEKAKINLNYCKVEAPISGRIGRSMVTKGALVDDAMNSPLAVIQQIDPMRVNFSQDSNTALTLYRAQANGKLVSKEDGHTIKVHLILPDGHEYSQVGQLLFSEVTVDASTAQIQMRAEIPNPDGELLPGMFAQVRFEQAVYAKAILVPQQAVMRSEKGDIVMVVGKDNMVSPRPVTIAGDSNNQWIITDGLHDGDKVMVEGFQKLRPGAPVDPQPWSTANETDDNKPAQDANATDKSDKVK